MWVCEEREETEVCLSDQSLTQSAGRSRQLRFSFALDWGPLECGAGRGCCLRCGG